MTNLPSSDRGTLFDLPFETARERITLLRASRSPVTMARPTATASDQPPLRRLRSALGSRLIEVGRALLAEDGAPRSATRT